MYRPSSGAVTPMSTIRAMSCAHPAAVIRTGPGTGAPQRGTSPAGPQGRVRRCSRRSPGDPGRLALARLRYRRLTLVEFGGVVAADDPVAAARERDAHREEPDDEKQHPDISHATSVDRGRTNG